MITIRASSTADWPDCELRTLARTQPRMFIDANLEIRELPGGTAGHLGTAVHAGGAGYWRAILAGEPPSIGYLEDLTMQELRERFAEGATGDDLTPDYRVAEVQARKMLRSYIDANPPGRLTPILIEQRRWAKPPNVEGVALAGQVDLIGQDAEPELLLDDLKNSRARPYHGAQVGTYDIIAEANHVPVGRLFISWNRRVGPKTEQPPILRIPFDRTRARRQAWTVLDRMIDVTTRFAEKRDPRIALANPASRLCSAKWCPLFGTRTCSAWSD